jgi:protoheme IX farnesyltransferase
VTIEGVLLFAIVFFWQPPHFWALAIRLEPDYRSVGIPMMPVVLGEHETRRQTVLYAVATVMVTLIFGAVAELAWLYFAVAGLAGAGFIGAAVQMYRGRGLDGTAPMFRYSTLYLAALFLAMVADTLLF